MAGGACSRRRRRPRRCCCRSARSSFSRVTFAGLGAELPGDPVDGRRADRRDGGRAGGARVRAARAAAGWIAHVGAAGLVRSADLVRFAPALTWRVAPPSWVAVVVYYIAGGRLVDAVAAALRRRGSHGAGRTRRVRRTSRRRSPSPPRSGSSSTRSRSSRARRRAAARHVPRRRAGRLRRSCVFPRGATMLVDAGGLSAASSFDIGDRVVAPVLRRAGFRRLDCLVLTHGDPDHIGGAASIISRVPAARGLGGHSGAALRAADGAARGRRSARARGGRTSTPAISSSSTASRSSSRHPRAADWERQKVRNDDSIVLELRWRDVSVLLTGDIGRAVEREIARDDSARAPARRQGPAPRQPRRRARRSSSRRSRPQIAVVSAGRGNHFGHPVPEVLRPLPAVGARVFRTDRDGAVTMDTDGYSIEVRTFTGRHLATCHENTKARRHEGHDAARSQMQARSAIWKTGPPDDRLLHRGASANLDQACSKRSIAGCRNRARSRRHSNSSAKSRFP